MTTDFTLEPGAPAPRPSLPVRVLLDTSHVVLQTERRLLSGLMFLLAGLVLLNVVTRYSGMPVYWVDEASVYAVVWLTFVGASVMTRLRLDFCVGLITEKLGPRGVKIAQVISTLGILVFGLSMIGMCLLWMDPIGIIRHGFDAREFGAQTFNFLYTERTQTLNWPTWIVQLILPLFSITLTLHALANLVEDLSLAPRRHHAGFHVSNPELVN